MMRRATFTLVGLDRLAAVPVRRLNTASLCRWGIAVLLFTALLALTACAARAQDVGAVALAQASPPAATAARVLLSERVAAEIGQRWGVEPASVRLEWEEEAASRMVVTDEPSFRLLGSGADGRWIVAFDSVPGVRPELRLWVRAGVVEPHAVAAHDLERGVVLAERDIRIEPAISWGPSREPNASEQVAPGWVTHRRLAMGDVLSEPAVARPLLVRSGDTVRILFTRGHVELALAGRAAGSAALGERVAVRAATGKRLEGVVVRAGVVRVNGLTGRN